MIRQPEPEVLRQSSRGSPAWMENKSGDAPVARQGDERMTTEVANLFNPQAQNQSIRPDPRFRTRQPGKNPSPGRLARSRSLRLSTTVRSSQSATACSARAFSVRSRITNACAAKYKRMKYKGVICEKCGCGGHPCESASGTHGTYRSCGSSCAHLVSEISALPHRSFAGHDAQGSGACSLLRELYRNGIRALSS